MKQGELEQIPLEIEKLFSNLEMEIMQEMVRLIKTNGFSGGSADYLMMRLRALGESEENVAKFLEKALEDSGIELNKVFDDEVYQQYYGQARGYKLVGLEQILFKDNVELQQLIGAVKTQTVLQIGGLTKSLGFVLRTPAGKLVPTPLQTFYEEQLDQAVIDITSGAFSYNKVIERVINRMTNSGVRVIDFESGATRSMVSAVRTAVMTGFRQVNGHITDQVAKDLKTDTFEVTWHGGARPSHQEWQGKVYTRKQLEEVCGLGSVTGLHGANCYHDYHPFIPGVSRRTYTDEQLEEMNAIENIPKMYNGKEYTTYEALQHQRYLERKARKYRQDIHLLQKGKFDGVDLENELINKGSRYRHTISQYNDFTKKMKLPNQKERIYMDGLGKIKVPDRKVIKPNTSKELPLKPKQISSKKTSFTKSQLDKMSLDDLKKQASILAKRYYESGQSGISFGNASIDDAVSSLVSVGTKTSLKKDILSMQKKLNDGIISVGKSSLKAEPNSITEVISKKGDVTRNYYGNDGKQFKQITFGNHGNPKHHPYGKNGEHAHDYIYDDKGNLVDRPMRELTQEEKEDNDDIL